MKVNTSEYIKIVMYTILSILFAMSTYLIIINIHHYNSLTNIIAVSDIDNDYVKYKDNVNLIEEVINEKIESSNEMYLSLTDTLNNMKKGGVFRLIPKSKLTYKDLYELNDFFMEELINNSWIKNIKINNVSEKYQDTIDMLVSNSKYLNSVFTGNSLILYDDSLDNKIDDNYHFILSNYTMYSNVILDICNEIGGDYE